MKTAGKVVLYVALFLLVPFIIGRVTAGILGAVNPPSEYAGLVEQLEHVRGQTRLTLLVITGYYVALVAILVGLRLRKRAVPPTQGGLS